MFHLPRLAGILAGICVFPHGSVVTRHDSCHDRSQIYPHFFSIFRYPLASFAHPVIRTTFRCRSQPFCIHLPDFGFMSPGQEKSFHPHPRLRTLLIAELCMIRGRKLTISAIVPPETAPLSGHLWIKSSFRLRFGDGATSATMHHDHLPSKGMPESPVINSSHCLGSRLLL